MLTLCDLHSHTTASDGSYSPEELVQYAKEKGLHRIELNMWEFNQGALAFYEATGFVTFRRYMEMFI